MQLHSARFLRLRCCWQRQTMMYLSRRQVRCLLNDGDGGAWMQTLIAPRKRCRSAAPVQPVPMDYLDCWRYWGNPWSTLSKRIELL